MRFFFCFVFLIFIPPPSSTNICQNPHTNKARARTHVDLIKKTFSTCIFLQQVRLLELPVQRRSQCADVSRTTAPSIVRNIPLHYFSGGLIKVQKQGELKQKIFEVEDLAA